MSDEFTAIESMIMADAVEDYLRIWEITGVLKDKYPDKDQGELIRMAQLATWRLIERNFVKLYWESAEEGALS